MKRCLILVLTLMLLVTCTACGQKAPTAQEIVAQMQAALTATPCTQTEIDMDMTLSMEVEGTVVEAKTQTTTRTTMSLEPLAARAELKVTAIAGGETTEVESQSYMVEEDGQLVSYALSNGVWMRVLTGQTVEELTASMSSVRLDEESVAIDETVTEYNGQPVICLTTTLRGEDLSDYVADMFNSMGQQNADLGEAADLMEKVDYTALTCETRIYLDKTTHLPLVQEMTFQGMGDVLAGLYQEMGLTVDVKDCTGTARYLSFEEQAAITLPEGAKEKAARWERILSGEPDNGDGTYTIYEGAAYLDIVAPEGFELTDKGYDHVSFKRDDQRTVQYTVYTGTADVFTAMVDRQLGRYGDLPKKVNRTQMTLPSESLTYTTEIVGVEWQSYEEGLIWAWADLGTDGEKQYFLLVEIEDGYNNGTGSSKSADITPDEMMALLSGAAMSDIWE